MEQTLPTQQPAPVQAIEGELHWRLSSHPLTLLTFLGFRISSLVIYLLSAFITMPFTLVFILTILLTAADFYYLKNIAGRRLVGLRWWNEVEISTGESKWVFESADGRGSSGGNKTDTRFFWLALYAQPALWVALGLLAIIRFKFDALLCVVVALILTITNTVAFSRCDKFSQASGFANRAMYSSGLARNVAGSVFSRLFSSR